MHLRSFACLTLSAVLSLPLAACGSGGGGGGAPVTPPVGGVEDPVELLEIVETYPVDGTTAPLSVENIIVEFATPIDPATVADNQIILESPVGAMRGEVYFDEVSNMLNFVPETPLAGGLDYVARVLTGIKDFEGRILDQEVFIRFDVAERSFTTEFPAELEANPTKIVARAEYDSQRAVHLMEVQGVSNTEYHLGAINDYGTWIQPEFIASNVNPRIDPEYGMAVSRSRDTVVAWTREVGGQRDLWLRYQARGESLFPPRSIEIDTGIETSTPVVAIDDEGNAVIAWAEGSSTSSLRDVKAVVYNRAGELFGPFPLEASAGIAKNVRVAMNGDGRGVVVWAQKTSAFFDTWSVPFNMEDGFGGRRQVDSYSGGDALPLRVLMREDGSAVGVMHQIEPAIDPEAGRLVGMTAPASIASWNTASTLDTRVEYHEVAMPYVDELGVVTFAWSSGDADVHDSVRTRSHTAAGTWASPATFQAETTSDVGGLRLVGTPVGELGAAWSSRDPDTGRYAVFMSLRSRYRNWIRPRVVGANDSTDNWVRFDAGIERGGNGRVIYDPFISGSAVTNRVLGRALHVDGTLGDLERLDNPNDLVARNLTLFINHFGIGAAVWGRFEGVLARDVVGANLR